MVRHLKRGRPGRAKARLTELGLGTARFGEPLVRSEDGIVTAAMGWARAGGIRYFDSSPFYGDGMSELRVGRALKRPADPEALEPGQRSQSHAGT